MAREEIKLKTALDNLVENQFLQQAADGEDVSDFTPDLAVALLAAEKYLKTTVMLLKAHGIKVPEDSDASEI